MSGTIPANSDIRANGINSSVKSVTGGDSKQEIIPQDVRGIIEDLSRAHNANQALKDQLTKFTAFGPEAMGQVADFAKSQDIKDITSTLEELAEAKWNLINPYKSSEFESGGFAPSHLYYEVTTTKNKSFIARLSAGGSGVRFD